MKSVAWRTGWPDSNPAAGRDCSTLFTGGAPPMWQNLTSFEMFFWGVALLATLLLVFKLVFGELFEDLTELVEGDVLSLNALLVGFKVMGWIGVVCLQLTRFSRPVVIGAALVAGTLTFVAATFMVRRLKRLEDDGTLNLANAVYLTIPARMEGIGQIQIEVQGRLATVNAKTTGPALPTGEKVFVYDVEGTTLLVVHENEMNVPTRVGK
jgi:membrane protein implicated in regulation of membrane protease activity